MASSTSSDGTSSRNREGADVIATVHFASVGRKRLSLQYAHLEEI